VTASDSTSSSGRLHIEADLTVGLTESTLRVQSADRDDTLYVDARSLEALSELRAAVDSEAVSLLQELGIEAPFAVETPVVIRVRGVAVGSYQSGKRAGRLAEALGVAPFRPRLGGLLRAAVRRFRPVQ